MQRHLSYHPIPTNERHEFRSMLQNIMQIEATTNNNNNSNNNQPSSLLSPSVSMMSPSISKAQMSKYNEDDVDDLEDVRRLVQRMQHLQKDSQEKQSMIQERDKILRQAMGNLDKDIQQELSVSSVRPAEMQGLARALLSENGSPTFSRPSSRSRSVSPLSPNKSVKDVLKALDGPRHQRLKLDRQTSIHAMEILLKNIQNLQHEQDVVDQMLMEDIANPNNEYKTLSPRIRENLRVLEEQIKNTIAPGSKVKRKQPSKGKSGAKIVSKNALANVESQQTQSNVKDAPAVTFEVKVEEPQLPNPANIKDGSLPPKPKLGNRKPVPSNHVSFVFDKDGKVLTTHQTVNFSPSSHHSHSPATHSHLPTSHSLDYSPLSDFPPPPELLQSIVASQRSLPRLQLKTPPPLHQPVPGLPTSPLHEEIQQVPETTQARKALKLWSMDDLEALMQAHQDSEEIKTNSKFYNQFKSRP